ncbi:hypothetical protein VNI00_007858 [Paramarasmius palmivorus]|uniref:Uncharacterized protein n=1 Tax=Paramarasmius palmivorus TaxID=297713 RepID=A0AAW0CZ66_9AGAR
MPPKKRTRERLERQTNNAAAGLAPEVIAKRTKRHLDELERSNYAEPTLLNEDDPDDGVSGKYAKGRARQTISDKRNHLNIAGTSPAASNGKKKSTMNVRTALLYRKNFATLLEESVADIYASFYYTDVPHRGKPGSALSTKIDMHRTVKASTKKRGARKGLFSDCPPWQ